MNEDLREQMQDLFAGHGVIDGSSIIMWLVEKNWLKPEIHEPLQLWIQDGMKAAIDDKFAKMDNALEFMAKIQEEKVAAGLVYKPGQSLVVTNPKHADSTHAHSFSGTIVAVHGHFLTVTDQNGDHFDIYFDEVESVGEK